jgi:allantoin racemase
VPLDPASEFHFRPVKAGPTSFMSPHDWTLMDLAIFEAGADAQAEGYDAVCIDTMSDSGLAALRSVLDIPVVSPGRASMLFALTLGSKFSVLAQWPPAIVRYRKALAEYGLAQHCASVRSFDIPPNFDALLDGKEDSAFPRCSRTCMRASRRTARRDLPGSTTMHQAAVARAPAGAAREPRAAHLQAGGDVAALRLTTAARAPSRRCRLAMLHAMLDAAARAEQKTSRAAQRARLAGDAAERRRSAGRRRRSSPVRRA